MQHSQANPLLVALSIVSLALLHSTCRAQTAAIDSPANPKSTEQTVSTFLDEADELLKTGKVDEAILKVQNADIESIVRKQLKTGSSFYLSVDSGPSIEPVNLPGLSRKLTRKVIHQTSPMGGGVATKNFATVGCGCMGPGGKEGMFELAKIEFAHRLNLVMFHLGDENDKEIAKSVIQLNHCRKLVDMTEQQWSSIPLVSRLKIRQFIQK